MPARQLTSCFPISAMLVLAAVALPVHAADTGIDSIPDVLAQYFEHRPVPELSAAEVDELRTGMPVVWAPEPPRDDDTDSEFGIIGLKIVAAPRLLVWLSLLAETEYLNRRVTRAVLLSEPGGMYVRYHHLNLPWPVADRHWVVRIRNDVDLAARSNNLVWERHWRLDDDGTVMLQSAFTNGELDGVTQRMLDRSICLRANTGAWALVDLGVDGTLVVAYVDARLGGYIPRGLVRSYTKRKLRAGLASLSEREDFLNPGYDGSPIIYDGHGSPISIEVAQEAARRWEAGKND